MSPSLPSSSGPGDLLILTSEGPMRVKLDDTWDEVPRAQWWRHPIRWWRQRNAPRTFIKSARDLDERRRRV